MATTRIEQDSIGPISIAEDACWGAQTQRSLENFAIGTERMPSEIIHAFALQKRCAAVVNRDLGLLAPEAAKAIAEVCQEILKGAYQSQFPLSVWQTGSGTQTNMNFNEVISNLANLRLGGGLGAKSPVHPNDHCNLGQSSNDTFPTVMHMAVATMVVTGLSPVLDRFLACLATKQNDVKDVIKIGRTHLQDATPLSFAQVFSGYYAQIEFCAESLDNALDPIYELAQGGTAVGTGINSHPEFGVKFAAEVASYTGLPFRTAPNKFAALAAHEPLVALSGVLNTLATAVMKIANDIRWLGSGPRSGLGELTLPANEPGSSIMPGKVNPTQCEALTMVAAQVMGNHTTVTLAASQGNFELNVYKPVIIYNIIQSIRLLSDAIDSFCKRCLMGLEVNKTRVAENVQNSLMLVTALNPHIGYDNAAKIAKYAYENALSLKAAAAELQLLEPHEFERLVDIKAMVAPQEQNE